MLKPIHWKCLLLVALGEFIYLLCNRFRFDFFAFAFLPTKILIYFFISRAIHSLVDDYCCRLTRQWRFHFRSSYSEICWSWNILSSSVCRWLFVLSRFHCKQTPEVFCAENLSLELFHFFLIFLNKIEENLKKKKLPKSSCCRSYKIPRQCFVIKRMWLYLVTTARSLTRIFPQKLLIKLVSVPGRPSFNVWWFRRNEKHKLAFSKNVYSLIFLLDKLLRAVAASFPFVLFVINNVNEWHKKNYKHIIWELKRPQKMCDSLKKKKLKNWVMCEEIWHVC